MAKVVTLTLNPAVDKSSSVNSVAAEIKMRCTAPRFDPGGGGVNVSRAMHQLGAHSTAIITRGGGTGVMLEMLLQQEGIAPYCVDIQDYTRENLSVYEESTGLQYRFGMPGPILQASEWEAATEACFALQPDYLVASGSLPPGMPNDYYAHLAQRAQQAGVQIIVDTSGPALEALVDTRVFLIKPNLAELESLSGEKFSGETQLRAVGQRLIASGMAQVLVVSLGSAGAACITETEFVQMRPPVVPIQSKVGAGDSMVGGIMTALSQDRPLLEAVRYGIAAGTAAVMTPGTDLCRKEDTDEIYERISILNSWNPQ